MGYTRNMSWFVQRSYSVYPRMAVDTCVYTHISLSKRGIFRARYGPQMTDADLPIGFMRWNPVSRGGWGMS